MTQRFYKSDFDFVLRLIAHIKYEDGTCEEQAIGWPNFDWVAKLYTSDKTQGFVASRKGTTLTNCYEDGGEIHIVCNKHRLGPGKLNVEFCAELPNDAYPAGVEVVYSVLPLDIELVTIMPRCITAAEVEAAMPFAKGDPFTYEDFTPEQIAELQKPALDAAVVANAAATKANEAANSANDAATIANMAAENAEATNTKVSAAETARVTEFATIKQEATEATTAATEAAANANSAIGQLPSQLAAKQDKLTVLGDLNLTDDAVLSLTDMAKKRLFIDLWNEAWKVNGVEYGKYDPTNAPDPEHPFAGNELWMTYEEAINVYAWTAGKSALLVDGSSFTFSFSGAPIITNIPFPTTATIGLREIFYNCDNIKIINIGTSRKVDQLYYSFFGCNYLKKIIGVINYIGSTITSAFDGCYNLQDFNLKGLKTSLNISKCSKVSYESIHYLITNAINTTAITVTVHADVYAKLTGDTTNAAAAALSADELAQWTALLETATAKNIQFVTP